MPFVDYFNNSLLTIQYMYVVPVALARWLDVNAISIWMLMTWLQMLLSICVSWRMSRYLYGNYVSSMVFLVVPLAVSLLSWFTFLSPLLGESSIDFAQREHLFFLYAAPWILARHCSWEGRSLPRIPLFLLGLVSGFMASIKPHFVLVLLAVELYGLLRFRRWRTLFAAEAVGFACAGFGYAAFLLLHLQVLQGMLETLEYTMAFHMLGRQFDLDDITRPQVLVPCIIGVISIMWSLISNGVGARLLGSFAVLTLMGEAIAAMQLGGHIYRHLVLLGGGFASLGVLVVQIASLIEGKFFSVAMRALFAISLLLVTFLSMAYRDEILLDRITTPDELREVIEATTEPGDGILFMTGYLGMMEPYLTISDRNQAFSMMDRLVLEPMDDNSAKAKAYIDQIADVTRKDILKSPPLIVVDTSPWHHITRFLLEYELLDLIQERYQLVGRVEAVLGTFDVYAFSAAPQPQGTSFTLGDKFELYSWHIQPVDGVTLQACDRLELMTWWHPLEQDLERFTLHVDLVKPDGGAVLEQYGRIGTEEDYSAVSTIIDQRQLDLPCELESGVYWLLLSMEDMSVAGGDVLPVSDSDGGEYGKYVFLGEFEIGA